MWVSGNPLRSIPEITVHHFCRNMKGAVETCINNGISTVVVGDITKSLFDINLGKQTNQNLVNLSLGEFIDIIIGE